MFKAPNGYLKGANDKLIKVGMGYKSKKNIIDPYDNFVMVLMGICLPL